MTHVALSGYVLDFIALDGSVSLSLLTDEGTVDSTAGDVFVVHDKSAVGEWGQAHSADSGGLRTAIHT